MSSAQYRSGVTKAHGLCASCAQRQQIADRRIRHGLSWCQKHRGKCCATHAEVLTRCVGVEYVHSNALEPGDAASELPSRDGDEVETRR